MTDIATTAAAPATAAGGEDLLTQLARAGAPTTAAPPAGPRQPSRFHENVTSTSLDDESVSSSDYDQYKGRKGFTDRIAVLYPSRVMAARVHFIKTPQGGDSKLGGYLICSSKFSQQNGQDVIVQAAACCEKLEVAQQRFGLLVLQYNTDPHGKPTQPFGFSLRLWRFNATMFASLRTSNKEFPLTDHDILLSCTDEQYQKMTLQSCRERICSHDQFKTQFGPQVEGWVATMMPRVATTLGKRLSAQEWSEVLGGPGLAAAAGIVAGPADTPVESIAALLQVPSVK